eukprot:CAMPEP_0173111450 /NCGR_PEP_ID=MMETSP1102-20130122/45190_1 /TAXON_ID=49646 /ORGANISM="Geminigera sp., Strain Caron Lab Isolate" /LENGTH=47 /DNA_ID= /DNA_START= /DNA_END= /DNA_ORIENTATION=
MCARMCMVAVAAVRTPPKATNGATSCWVSLSLQSDAKVFRTWACVFV